MCTLSWQIRDNRLTIIFNRDESIKRQEAEPPKIETIGETNVLAPKDPEGGGTWIAVNEYGMVFCMMNNYQTSFKPGPDDRYHSRGMIIRTLSTTSSLHHLRRMLGEMDPGLYKPFYLIVFPGVFPPLQWQWDGKNMEEIVAPFPLITTSYLFPKWTEILRIRAFCKETENFTLPLSEDRQQALHRSRRPWPPVTSIAMKGKNGATVSMTRIRIDPEVIHMTYQPGDPVTTRQPVHEQKIKRKSNPSIERRIVLPDNFSKDLIDIEKVLREKNLTLYRKFPRWAIGLLRALVKEKTLNEYFDKTRELPCNFLASNVLNHLGVRAKIKPGSGAMPESGKRLIFLSNHPTGGLDGLLMLSWLSHYYPDIRIIGNDTLWFVPHIRPWLVPVDIYRQSRKSMDNLFRAYEKDSPLLIYPSGQVARKIKGKLKEAPWEKMAAKLAREYNRSIVLIHINGYNSRLFNSVAWFRRAARTNLNLELLFLSRALIKPACKMYGITIGPVLSPEQIKTMGKNDYERASKLQQNCANLVDSSFQDIIS